MQGQTIAFTIIFMIIIPILVQVVKLSLDQKKRHEELLQELRKGS